MMTVSPIRMVAALAQFFALAADAPDVILVVQRDVLHDDAADADRFELADRRERAGASDLDLDIPEHGHGALGRELVGDRPARRPRHEPKPLLPVDAIDLVDDAVDVVVEMRPPGFDLAMEASNCSTELQSSVSGLVLKPQRSNHLIMPDWVASGISLISPQE